MKYFRPLFLQNLDVRSKEYELKHLQVNRHLRELDRVESHAHEFYQIIVYLAGGGYQLLEQGGFSAQQGTVVMFPPHCPHSFRETGKSRPLCLVLDFQAAIGSAVDHKVSQFSQRELAELKEHLSDMMRHASDGGRQQASMRSHGRILMVLDLCLYKLGMAGNRSASLPSPVVRSVQRLLQDRKHYHEELSVLARRIGYKSGYLNQLLKESTGLTLGQLRAQRIMSDAEKLLIQGKAVSEVADTLGFTDQNYFARWFKRQRGASPTAWRKAATVGAAQQI
jgi:AraC-like DNA-binding protein/mannose-6-phosphate isomerase-like protein (cupin superfamily)